MLVKYQQSSLDELLKGRAFYHLVLCLWKTLLSCTPHLVMYMHKYLYL